MTLRSSISSGRVAGQVAGRVVAAAAAAIVLAACSGPVHTEQSSVAGRPPSPATSPMPAAITQSACERRPDASGDILVRITTNGQPAVTQQMGGAWTWDTRTHACITPVQAVISTASANAGNCTQVAYAASNPGYRLTASPAPALKKVVAAKGPAC
ncbi:MAG TPA: hypothetical protein VGD68_08185 [Streptosporangiaceae bacterium]